MKLHLFAIKLLAGFLLCSSVQYVSVAQKQPEPNCGTEISPEQAKALQQQAILAFKRKMATNGVFTTVTYVPIRPHIIRRSDGTGGFDLASLNTVMAATNRYYMTNGLGIQFYFAGEMPHYINSDSWYYNFPYYNLLPLDPHDVTNAMNQYYPYSIESSAAAGYAFYPDNSIVSTRSVISTNQSNDYIGNHLIPHELGHNFSLLHTHGASNGTVRTDELVTRGAGANCTAAGDFICDTPADPYLIGNQYEYVTVDGCLQYSPNNVYRDANGDPYTPSITNIMSYYHYYETDCPSHFTPGQYERIQGGLAVRQGHTAYTLDYPAVNVAPVTNLNATPNSLWVQLSWQDNANNEMGYFIERSTSPSAGFVSVGGVEPNATSFTDRTISPNTTYYYRIRPSNTTTGNLSPNATITTSAIPPITGLTTTNITGTSAQLIWNSLGDGVEYDVQWRQIGNATWNVVRRISAPTTQIGPLLTITDYEWQVKPSIGSTYSGTVTFSTVCPIPNNLFSASERIRAVLSWGGVSNQTYTLQWRQAGTSDWTTVNNLTTNTYTLKELASTTVYEWRVQDVCSPTVQSEFSAPQSFTTRSCQLPYSTSLNSVSGDFASLSWFFSTPDPPRTVDLRYRPVGTPTWTTISSLTTTYTTGTYQLTGLANNTVYEWQLRSVCSSTDQTDYTAPNSFTTICRTPGSLLAKTSATQAQLSWRITPFTQSGNTFIVQYRPVGSSNWTTTTSTVTSFTGGSANLSGLTTGTTYEWRVQTTCSLTALSDFSNIAQFTTNCSVPLANGFSVAFVTSNSAQLNWTIMDDPANHYDVRYRVVGSSSWTTISTLGTNVTLTGLTNYTSYEWQVRTVCYENESAGFTAGPNFTTLCRAPIFRVASPQVTAATLNWELIGGNVTYNIQYRKSGTTNWTTINNVTSASYIVTNLTANTTYEWQLATICSDGITIGYSQGANFTTYACDKPSVNAATNITTNSAQLNWYFSYPSADTRFQARYRAVGATDWITLDNLMSTSSLGYTIINGLASGTTYEWQIRTICSASESSDFTTISTSYSRFQTLTPCPIMYTIQTGLWNDPSTWSCNRIPTSDDAVQIKHAVIIPASYIANARRINYDAGKAVKYGTDARLKTGF
ncbi:fibronectin type III domain-containing protein [Spirosoma sp. BT702]|uniref:Fibronectin type III domain-containing protein n=1 Tax=Spirosoma profusum TaxID=2771354 RepID=A0A926Y451_9BACT|nr:fibronectin type III domain-containing protein [Spirosoma profusum]MBD2702666.1 fibronectin type III domain-containing protein [Spirosoma profusum]